MANEKTVIVGCRLPHGLIIENPLNLAEKATLRGLNSTLIIGATHATTEIDADLWAAWKAVHSKHPAVTSGAIFEAGNQRDAEAKAKELAKEKTGFEPMPQSAEGVKPADAKE